MATWVMDVMTSLGYLGIVALVVAENLFPPIPSELILPLAGYLSARGELSLWGVVLAGGAGSVLGAIPLYYLGRRWGMESLIRFAERHGRWLTLSPADLRRGEAWFARRGALAVLVSRMIPGARSLIALPAGIAGMSLIPFILCTLLGSLLWTAALAGLGYLLEGRFEQVDRYLDPVSWVVFGGALLLYLRRVFRQRGEVPQGGES